ncbi:MAG: OmpA family protein [Cytophagaceae bacterium]|nr:OmpA family protein [Cytophagaceae bacterium]
MRAHFTIFLLLFSLLVSNCNKPKAISKSVQPANKNLTKAVIKDSTSKNITVHKSNVDEQEKDLIAHVKDATITKHGDSIQLVFSSGILFDHNSDQLSEDAKKNIDALSEVLKRYPDSKISIFGHTDNTGSADYNQKLSERRALAVSDYLISKKINSKRFKEVKGHGEEKPVKDNNTLEGRNQNRRVEISILPPEENKVTLESFTNSDTSCYCYYDEYKNFICKQVCDSWIKVPMQALNNGQEIFVASNHSNIWHDSRSGKHEQKKTSNTTGVILRGNVYNAKTREPIAAQIIFEVLPDGLKAGLAESDSVKGDYQIVLEKGNHYGYWAKAQGYLSINENISVPAMDGYNEIRQDLYLVPIEEGQEIKLNNVFFQQSKAELLPSSYSELNQIVQFLKNNPKVVIELHGHTDNHGNPKTNYLLSQRRVEQIKSYLVSKGISHKRIMLKAFGGTKPIASNDTQETRKLNRRVEFKIIKK